MAVFRTQHLGDVEYGEESIVEFAGGIPAFPQATSFILIEPPEMSPLLFLQCLSEPALCFLTIPVECLDRDYRLTVMNEELEALGPGEDLLRLAILTVAEGKPPTANMMSPVVINRGTRRGRQMIQLSADYSFTQPLEPSEEAPC